MAKANIHVAIAILLHQQNVLVGWREAKQHQGNKYEFPGGKVEANETPEQACRREVLEEVGIDISEWYVFDFICHEYEDVIVHLHIFHAMVTEAQCECIQEPWTWYQRDALLNLNFPKANSAMLQRLYWQPQLKISANLQDVKHLIDDQLLYWRTGFTAMHVQEVASLTDEQLSKLVLNVALWSKLDNEYKHQIAAVHLKQQQLLQLRKGDLTVGTRFIAACHDVKSVLHAQEIGCDAVLLSPVKNTATHPDYSALGWTQFQAIANAVDIPVFALGGLSPMDLDIAQQHGAYGIAGIRSF